MKQFTFTLKDARSVSCTSGKEFISMIFAKYGEGKQITVTNALLKTILSEFKAYLKATKKRSLKAYPFDAHIEGYIDNLVDKVRKDKGHLFTFETESLSVAKINKEVWAYFNKALKGF